MDKNYMCRLCLSSSEEFVCIFDEETYEILPEINSLLEYFQLTLLSHEGKSSIMCIKCYVKLSDFKEFRVKCEDSEKVWDQLCVTKKEEVEDYEEMQPEIEIIDEFYDEIEEEKRKKSQLKVRKKATVKKQAKKSASCKSSVVMETVSMNTEDEEHNLTIAEDEKIKNFYDFSCDICEPKEKFDSMIEYKVHMKLRHNQKRATITCCNRKLSKRHELIDHMHFHSEPERLACQICMKFVADRKCLAAHMKRIHGTDSDKKYQCDYCKKRFIYKKPLQFHLMIHLSEETKKQLKTHLCNECGQTFIHENVLQSHIKYVHLKHGHICDLCGRHFKVKFDYELHRRNAHGIEGPSRKQCPICHLWYSNEKAMRDHIRYLHKERQEKIVCKICNDVLSSKPGLRSHYKMKHAEKLHRCNYCDKALPTAVRLKEHEAMHTGISLYTCSYCPKEFNMRSNMYKHFKAMHPDEWTRDKADKNRNPEKWKAKEQKRNSDA